MLHVEVQRDGAWHSLPRPGGGTHWWPGYRGRCTFWALGQRRGIDDDDPVDPVESWFSEDMEGDVQVAIAPVEPLVRGSRLRGLPTDAGEVAREKFTPDACSDVHWMGGAELLAWPWDRPLIRGRGYVSAWEFARWQRCGYALAALPVDHPGEIDSVQVQRVSHREMLGLIEAGDWRSCSLLQRRFRRGRPVPVSRCFPYVTLVEWTVAYGQIVGFGFFPDLVSELYGPPDQPELAARYTVLTSRAWNWLPANRAEMWIADGSWSLDDPPAPRATPAWDGPPESLRLIWGFFD